MNIVADRRCRRLLAAWLCLAWASAGHAAADAPPLVLEHLTTSDGLPQGTVFSTLRDSRDLVGWGRGEGLVGSAGKDWLRYVSSHSAGGGLGENLIKKF